MENAPDNPYYPLPSDYGSLTPKGQKQARVACMKDQGSPEAMARAWFLLRSYYLQSPIGPKWYKPPVYESPACHYKFVYDVGRYERNVKALPRSYAKTTLVNELILTWMLGRTDFTVLLIKSRDKFVWLAFDKLKGQIKHNERIVEDFPGLKPTRDEGSWSNSLLRTTSHVTIIGQPVMGQMLGHRPNIVIFDDVEVEKLMQIAPTSITDNVREMYDNHVIPMLDEGCSALITGTLFSRNSFIYSMASVGEEEDPRLAYWNQEVVAVIDDEGELTWPGKFPWPRIQQLIDELGMSVFCAQYLNAPGSEADRLLPLHEDFSYYTVKEPDDAQELNPLKSSAILSCIRPSGDADPEKPKVTVIDRPYREAVGGMYRVILVDPIRRPSVKSDFACAIVIGVDRKGPLAGLWWLLDMRLGRVKTTTLTDWIWHLGRKWRPHLIGIESYSQQVSFAERMAVEVNDEFRGEGWIPRVYPITYKKEFNTSKASRIAGLAWRFEQHRVLLPKHLTRKPPWRDLIYQINNVTGDLKLLRFDDAIDTVAMMQFVIKTRRPPNPEDSLEFRSPLCMLEAGTTHDPVTGQPLWYCLNADELTPEATRTIDNLRFRTQKEAHLKRKAKRLPPLQAATTHTRNLGV